MITNFKKFYWGENTEVIFQPFQEKHKNIPVTACMAMATLHNEYLVLSSPNRGWGLPGGHREEEETPEETIIRELREETAVEINPKTLKVVGGWLIKKIHKTEKNSKYPDIAYMLLFIADITKVKQFTKRFEISDRAFVPIRDVFTYTSGENFKPIFRYITKKYKDRFIRKKHKDRVSVIIPIHNSEKNIPKCLENITYQTYQDIEVIIIDDKSTDKSYTLCKKYIDLDNRFTLIKHRSSKGIDETINTGLDFVKGNYIFITQPNSNVGKDTISKLVTKAIEKEADIVGYKNEEKDVYNKIFKTELFKNNHINFKSENNVLDSLYNTAKIKIFI